MPNRQWPSRLASFEDRDQAGAIRLRHSLRRGVDETPGNLATEATFSAITLG